MEATQLTVLIPGAGGAAGIGAIRALRMAGFKGRIIATDSNAMAAGLFLADKGYTVPPAADRGFLDTALDIIRKERVRVILPTSGFDILPYSAHIEFFAEMGVTAFMSGLETVMICVDKLRFYEALKDEFHLPLTVAEPAEIAAFPCIAKPVRGKGSRDIILCRDIDEAEQARKTRKDLLLQEYLPGEEYTIDVLSDMDGKALVAVARERIEVKAGISTKGRVIRDEKMETECLKAADFLGLRGPSCMQMKRDAAGEARLLEINPRMGGGTMFAAYAGVNIADLAVRLASGEKPEIPEINPVTVTRYYSEIVIEDEQKRGTQE